MTESNRSMDNMRLYEMPANDMIKVIQNRNKKWGVEGYEAPSIYFDHVKNAKHNENFLVHSGKKKREGVKSLNMSVDRGGIFKGMDKKVNSIPPPWQYYPKQKWGKYTGKKRFVPNIKMQRSMYIWTGNGKDKEMEIETADKSKQQKVNMSVSKKTYIDNIIILNSSKKYPCPGPTDFYMDEKVIKKFRKENSDIYAIKEKENNKKNALPKDKRNFIFSDYQRAGPSIPAPGYCQSYLNKTNKEVQNLPFKKFKEQTIEKNKRIKSKNAEMEDHYKLMMSSIGLNSNYKQMPIPSDFTTFDQLKQKYNNKENSSKKTLGFGVGSRLPLNEEEKWRKKAKQLGEIDPKINIKLDQTPGPMAYSLIANWQGKKKRSKSGEIKEEKVNYLNRIHKGPSINPYYIKY